MTCNLFLLIRSVEVCVSEAALLVCCLSKESELPAAMLSGVSRAAARGASYAPSSKAIARSSNAPIRLFSAVPPVTRPPLHALRQRRRSCSGPSDQIVRRLSSARVVLQAKVDKQPAAPRIPSTDSAARPANAPASSIAPTDRPIIPPTPLPELSPSPLLAQHPTPPPPASSTIRTAIADFLAAEQIGDVKPPPADLTRIKRLWWQAKQLFAFYWNGLKGVYANWRRACQLRMGVEDHGWKLNRREEVFLRRVDSDVVKLIPFVLILIILEEALPLLVLYAPYLLPSTCILPSQLLRVKEKEEAVRRQGLVRLATAVEAARLHGPAQLDVDALRGACMALDLGKVATSSMLRRRLARRLQ